MKKHATPPWRQRLCMAASILAALGTPLFLLGCKQEPAAAYIAVSSDHGGVVRFSGSLLGDPFTLVQIHCNKNGMDAVPLGFFRMEANSSWISSFFNPPGGENLMTFQCIPALPTRLR
jgi:hypothetical protein